MTSVVEVIVTGPRDMMPGLVSALVHDRLIAGGHLFAIDSTYRWQGAVRNAQETRAALHTTEARVQTIIQRIREDHPYEVPCIVTLPFLAGDREYLDWVTAQTSATTGPEE